MLSQHQHSFHRGPSYEMQLHVIKVIHERASLLKICGQVNTIFLDFTKVFDTSSSRLLPKATFKVVEHSTMCSDEWFIIKLVTCSIWYTPGHSSGANLFLLYMYFINDLHCTLCSIIKG